MPLYWEPTNGSEQFFPGSNTEIVVASPAVHALRFKFPGIVGESQIFQERGGRPLACGFWCYNGFETLAEARAALDLFDSKVGEVGKLIERIEDQDDYTWQDVCFEGFERTPIQEKYGPMFDASGQLGWWCPGVLHFYQLRYEEP